jgi:DNA-directed RNA polymerase specialized sigma24 family protein
MSQPPIPTDKKALAEALLKRKRQRGRGIPPEKRPAILGAYLGGKSVADVALQCGVSEPTVRKVISDAIAEGIGEDE